jgi:hypothetical protein
MSLLVALVGGVRVQVKIAVVNLMRRIGGEQRGLKSLSHHVKCRHERRGYSGRVNIVCRGCDAKFLTTSRLFAKLAPAFDLPNLRRQTRMRSIDENESDPIVRRKKIVHENGTNSAATCRESYEHNRSNAVKSKLHRDFFRRQTTRIIERDEC